MQISDDSVRAKAAVNPASALGEILLRTDAVAFRWIAAPGWPVDLVSDNVRRWGFDPAALKRGEPPRNPDETVKAYIKADGAPAKASVPSPAKSAGNQ